MSTIAKAIFVTCTVASSVSCFAQNVAAPVTRAEERKELIQLENDGWQPNGNLANYPAGLQAAEAKIHSTKRSDSISLPISKQSPALLSPGIAGSRSSFYFGA